MLAVVQYQERLPGFEVLDEQPEKRTAGNLAHTHRSRHRLRYQVGVGDRGQVYPPDTVPELLRNLACHPKGETRLAAASRTGQREQSSLG